MYPSVLHALQRFPLYFKEMNTRTLSQDSIPRVASIEILPGSWQRPEPALPPRGVGKTVSLQLYCSAASSTPTGAPTRVSAVCPGKTPPPPREAWRRCSTHRELPMALGMATIDKFLYKIPPRMSQQQSRQEAPWAGPKAVEKGGEAEPWVPQPLRKRPTQTPSDQGLL